MNMHLAAFAAAKTDSTANETVTAVADPVLPVTANGGFLMPQDMRVLAAHAMNDTITRARLSVPSLRTLGLPDIFPVAQIAASTLVDSYAKWGETGPLLKKNDEVIAQMSNGASTVDTAFMAMLLRRTNVPVPPGPRTTLFASKSITLVAKSWVLSSITFDQVPPVGDYAIIGMAAYGTNAVYARLVFPQNTTFRPGCVAYSAVTKFDADPYFRFGRLGEWGRFYSVNLPQVEVLGDTAGAQTISFEFDVVQLSQLAG